VQTDSTHVRTGDTIRINASDGGHCSVVDHNITEEDMERGIFRQDLPEQIADLVITNCSLNTSRWIVNQNKFNITYTVENKGSKYANASNTTIYVDDIPVFNDSVELKLGESNTSTVGPFDPPRKSARIRVCADNDGAVAEIDESNNCMEVKFDLLPNLKCVVMYDKPLCEFVGSQGEYRIYYGFKNIVSGTYANASYTTINITTMSVLFSIDATFEDDLNKGIISDDLRDKFGTEGVPLSMNASVTKEKENEWMITDKMDITFVVRKEDGELNIYVSPIIRKVQEHEMHGTPHSVRPHEGLGPFLCVPNTTFAIRVCADADHEVLEEDETDNCFEQVFNCSVSAWKPDLIIVKESISTTWINRTNKTFTINYTVENIGRTNATASVTYIRGINDSVPELAPGKNHSGTVGPFRLSGYETTITICADYYDSTAENNEDNNCVDHFLGVPDLYITPATSISWIDPLNKTYSIEYIVCNFGYATSNVSKVSIYVDDNPPKEVNHLPVRGINREGPGCRYNTTGPFTMTGDNDTIKLCVEWEWGKHCQWMDTSFRYAGCLSHDNKTLFNAYTPEINKSCTFTGDVPAYPSPSTWPNGYIIKADDITIDGNGSALIGAGRYWNWRGNPTWVGIENRRHGSPYTGYKNVTIKNMEIREFHTGISIVNTEDITIENCTIHDNGKTDRYSHGITVGNSNHVKIDNCSVYNITGRCTHTRESGGHGIDFRDDCDYCNVMNSNIYHNYLSGIYASPTCKYLDISNNLIEDNGYCGRSGFCTGVNLHWKDGFGQVTNSTVLGNVILNNTGSGIYTTQGGIVIKDNIVKGSKNGTDVTGSGILIDGGWLTFLYNNTFCDSGKTDIVNPYRWRMAHIPL
jgi:hypothetical protein